MEPIVITYILTAVLSIVAAAILANFARRSARAKTKDYAKLTRTNGDSSSLGDEGLRKVLLQEMKEVVKTEQQSLEITRKVSKILEKELQKRVELDREQIRQKYDDAIEQHVQNEELAWDKYNKVLDDKKKTEAVVRSIAEGLVVVDAKGKVIMMNPAAEKLLDISREDKIGESLLDGLSEDKLVSLAKGSAESREIEITSPDDETKKILRASSAVVEDENGQTVGMVSVLSDITKQKELDRLKTNFVANVTHELRTPFVAIEKSISLILSKSTGEINATQEKFLDIADRNLKRLSLLINDLLDLSKLEAKKMGIKRQLSSIENTINEAVGTLKAWAGTKSIKIEQKIPLSLPKISIDHNRIIQVLINLIGNAIKFTPTGGTIIVEAVLGRDKKELEVSSQDSGPGIAKEDLDKVFNKFYQSGERSSTDINGTGIGLSIAKEIVELHGGRIWVESDKSQGAKFIFTLPL